MHSPLYSLLLVAELLHFKTGFLIELKVYTFFLLLNSATKGCYGCNDYCPSARTTGPFKLKQGSARRAQYPLY